MANQADTQKIQKLFSWIIVLGALALISYGVIRVVNGLSSYRPVVNIGSATLRADLAQTPAELSRGLAGRESIAEDQAMLFVFNESRNWSFWMKGMKIPIDIIWINDKKKVVHVEPNVQPDAEPYDTYNPPEPARYVLETKAGMAEKYGIKAGVEAKFNLEDSI